MYFSINKLPTGFIPTEDQDVMIMYTLPSGASLNRTKEVSKKCKDYFANNEKNNAKYVLLFQVLTSWEQVVMLVWHS